jgi:hypothetical protein
MGWREVWLHLSCNVMDWHRMGDSVEQRGINTCGKCARCGIPVMLDSQGNAFPAIILPEKTLRQSDTPTRKDL